MQPAILIDRLLAAGLGKSRQVKASGCKRAILIDSLLAAGLGKSRLVDANGQSRSKGYWQLG